MFSKVMDSPCFYEDHFLCEPYLRVDEISVSIVLSGQPFPDTLLNFFS